MKINFTYRIVLIYIIVGSLWILFSDKAILLFISDIQLLTRVQTYKGWFYVIFTGALLYILIKNHIARLKKTEAELIQAKEKAEEYNDLKTAFISNISHEIRTPMNGIIGFSDLLTKYHYDQEKLNQYCHHISKNAKELMAIVNNLIDISKIESKKIELQNSEFDVNELLNDLFKSFKQIAIDKSLDLMLEKEIGNTHSQIFADKNKIENIITNMLSNAIKFTESGFIKFGCNFEQEYLKFYVEDTGIGIDKSKQAFIFQQFGQVEKGLSRFYRGTGLGLAICASYVELMKGQIWVNSELGNGSTFCFTTPYQKMQTKPKLEEGPLKDFVKDWKNYTVLIAEDEDSNFEFLKLLLTVTKIKILHATNGLEAINICKTIPNVDLVLMDIKMPLMDGLTATKAIKLLRPSIPVIAQTAFAMDSDRLDALNVGCNELIIKPIARDQLMLLLDKYLI